MRTQFVSVIRSRSFRMRAVIWSGVAAMLFIVVVAASLVWLSGHHLVRTDKGLVVVPKRFVCLSGTRVDIRGWTWDDAVAHHDVSRALINAGYTDLLPQPPPEPTALEKASEKAKNLRDEAVAKSAAAWRLLKDKVHELRKNADGAATPTNAPAP